LGVKYIFVVIIILLSFYTNAQIVKDTSNFYYKLEKRADKHVFTSMVYDVIFESIDTIETIQPNKFLKKNAVNPFLKYKGKIIRDIHVIVLDPFGYSVNNFYGEKPDYLEKLGNKFHVTTKEHIIKNLLLFKPNEHVDVLAISETERILRLSPYTFDARIYVQKNTDSKSDSIDILVVTQDRWTATASSNFDLTAPNVIVYDKNILGFGHQYEQGFAWNNDRQHLSTSGRYSVFNIKKTYISAAAFYSTVKDDNQFGLSIERLFFSPLAKWAGGISSNKYLRIYNQTYFETRITKSYPINYNTFDIWAAKSFSQAKNKTESINKRISNYIVGARYFKSEYFGRPTFAIDTDRVNRDESLFLINLGYSQRKYYRDRYLFRYGANEDIPQGNVFEIVAGILKKELNTIVYYTGIKYGTGKHFNNFGYLSLSAGYGTFYNSNYLKNGVVNFDVNYFTDLQQLRKWYYRQFVRFKFVEGIDRESYESLNLNGSQMYGFSSNSLNGKSKAILNLEFVLYMPYKFIGFQFAPVLFYSVAGLANNFGSMFSNTFYQAFAVGVLIRNEYLVSSTFEISIGFYPYMPGTADNSFAANPISNYNIKARDYFITKPELVLYK
jgi:hypothetical protein